MAIETRGIFTLKELTNDLLKGEGVTYLDVFVDLPTTSAPNAGYFGGGNGSGTEVDRINYSDDTVSLLSDHLSSYSNYMGRISSLTDGYFVGGSNPRKTATDRIAYATETILRIPGANLTEERYGVSGTNNSDQGYITGGLSSPAPVAKQTSKMPFATETFSAVPSSGDLAAAFLYYGTGMGTLTNGYISTGYSSPPGASSQTNRLTYSSDTMARIPGADVPKSLYLSTSSSGTDVGLIYGGTPSGTGVSDVSKLTFSSESVATTPALMTAVTVRDAKATGNSSNGYMGGGGTPSAVSTIDKFVYATDTRSTIAATLGAASTQRVAIGSKDYNLPPQPVFPAQQFFTGEKDGPNTGYNCAGYDSAASDEIQKVDMDTDTLSVTSATTTTGKYTPAGNSSTTDGYVAGGSAPTGPTSTMDKLIYASDSCSRAPGADLSAATYGACGTGNQSFGYFSGGYVPPNRSSTDKLTYSSDTVARIPSGDMLEDRRAQTALCDGDTTFMGGSGGPILSSWEKLSFGTETCSAMPGTSFLTGTRYYFGSVGNKTDGYIAGGFPSSGNSLFQKLNYSSETLSMVPGNLYASTYGISTFGNLSFGYFTGGGLTLSNSGKMTYATETFADNPGTYSPTGRRYQIGVSSRRDNKVQAPLPTPTPQTVGTTDIDNGYFGGGVENSNASSSAVDKITFSTESVSRIPGADLSAAKLSGSFAGNTTDAYYGGGYIPSPFTTLSTMDKLTKATDTTAAAPGADLSGVRYETVATGNNDGGYWSGGRLPGATSTTEKCTYSSDTSAQLPATANLHAARYWPSATSSPSAGYFGGGSGYFSYMDKLTYADDTMAYTPGANLSDARSRGAATASDTAAYFCGGNQPSAISTVDKLTFASDTTTRIPSADLKAPVQRVAATGNTTEGYVSWGASTWPPGSETTIEKITYSTDTTSLSSAQTTTALQHRSGVQGVAGVQVPVVC